MIDEGKFEGSMYFGICEEDAAICANASDIASDAITELLKSSSKLPDGWSIAVMVGPEIKVQPELIETKSTSEYRVNASTNAFRGSLAMWTKHAHPA
jgi:hypothetical protein